LNEPADSPVPQVEEQDRQLPVLAEARPIERKAPVPLPVAVAAAAGGFVLGVATWVLVRVLRQPRPRRMRVGRGFGRRGQKVDVQATRSFLVDIHLLRDR
jgi:aminoglycoside phosphotransferase (APT) family kinase protein